MAQNLSSCIRTTGRIKKPKVFFDPSDDTLHSHSYAKTKKLAEKEEERLPIPTIVPTTPTRSTTNNQILSGTPSRSSVFLAMARNALPLATTTKSNNPTETESTKPTFIDDAAPTTFSLKKTTSTIITDFKEPVIVPKLNEIKPLKTLKNEQTEVSGKKATGLSKSPIDKAIAKAAGGGKNSGKIKIKSPEKAAAVKKAVTSVPVAESQILLKTTGQTKLAAKINTAPPTQQIVSSTTTISAATAATNVKSSGTGTGTKTAKAALNGFTHRRQTLDAVIQAATSRDAVWPAQRIEFDNIPNNVINWSVQQVAEYFFKYFPKEARAFKDHEIDGYALLLIKRNDILTKLPFKLGPALHLINLIEKIQERNPTIMLN